MGNAGLSTLDIALAAGSLSKGLALRTAARAASRGAFRLFDFALDGGRRSVFVFFDAVAIGVLQQWAKDRASYQRVISVNALAGVSFVRQGA